MESTTLPVDAPWAQAYNSTKQCCDSSVDTVSTGKEGERNGTALQPTPVTFGEDKEGLGTSLSSVVHTKMEMERRPFPPTFSETIDEIGMGPFQSRLLLVGGMVRPLDWYQVLRIVVDEPSNLFIIWNLKGRKKK